MFRQSRTGAAGGDWFLVVRCGIDLFWWYVYTVYSGLFMIVYWVYFGREWNVERGAGWNSADHQELLLILVHLLFILDEWVQPEKPLRVE